MGKSLIDNLMEKRKITLAFRISYQDLKKVEKGGEVIISVRNVKLKLRK